MILRGRAVAAVVAVWALGGTLPARAEGLEALDSAAVAEAGRWRVGILHPLDVGLGHGLALRTHPLAFFVAPNAIVRVAHLEAAGWALTGEYGLSVPTLAMRLLQGYLFPSWERSDDQIGWLVVPRAGAVASHGLRRADVASVVADVAVGIPLGRDDTPSSLDAPAPLELLFAPVTTGWRARAGAGYDASLSPRWRLRAALDLYLDGIEDASPLTVRALGAADLALGPHGRLSAGAYLWSSDQHAVNAAGSRVRSTDLLPFVDFVYTSP